MTKKEKLDAEKAEVETQVIETTETEVVETFKPAAKTRAKSKTKAKAKVEVVAEPAVIVEEVEVVAEPAVIVEEVEEVKEVEEVEEVVVVAEPAVIVKNTTLATDADPVTYGGELPRKREAVVGKTTSIKNATDGVVNSQTTTADVIPGGFTV